MGSTATAFEEEPAEDDAEDADEDDFAADELAADEEADDAPDALDALDAPDEEDLPEADEPFGASADGDELPLATAPAAELCDRPAPCETSVAEERAPLTWPIDWLMKTARTATSATTTAATIAATTRPFERFGTENVSGACSVMKLDSTPPSGVESDSNE